MRCPFCHRNSRCAHLVLEVDLYEPEVREGPLAAVFEPQFAAARESFDNLFEFRDALDELLEPLALAVDEVQEKELDPRPGLSLTLRAFWVKDEARRAEVVASFTTPTRPPRRTVAARARRAPRR
jgi:hypothetical protein